MERKLKPEVEAKYRLRRILPGEIVIGSKTYDFRKMNLAQADAFYEFQKTKNFQYLELKAEAKLPAPIAEIPPTKIEPVKEKNIEQKQDFNSLNEEQFETGKNKRRRRRFM